MSGLQVSRVAAAVLGTIVLACPALTFAADKGESPALREAREEYEAAKRKYEAELKRSIARSKRSGDADVVKELSAEIATLTAGFSPTALTGTWRFDYNNNSSRTYVFTGDGVVQYAEEKAIGRLVPRPGGLVIKFAGRGEGEMLYVEPAVRLNYFSRASDLGKKNPDYKAIGRKLD